MLLVNAKSSSVGPPGTVGSVLITETGASVICAGEAVGGGRNGPSKLVQVRTGVTILALVQPDDANTWPDREKLLLFVLYLYCLTAPAVVTANRMWSRGDTIELIFCQP